jgi:hypothetical protein
MKTSIITLSLLLSISGIAQPTVSGTTSPAKDTTILLGTPSITLTGTAVEANPGHPILDTTWTKTSGPAATITNSSNRMTTKVTGLAVGNYVFTLTATDKHNSASATVNVHVIPGSLPITLARFNASRNDAGIILTWQTTMESNNAAFIVQKSTDGSTWTDIATIKSTAVNGNSSTPINYSFQIFGKVITADMHSMLLGMTLLAVIALVSKLNKVYKSLILGLVCMFLFSCSKSVTTPVSTISAKTEYRLMQVDLDGHTTYSEVRMVN